MSQVNCDSRFMTDAVDPRFDTTADARSASKRRQTRIYAAGPVHDGGNLGFVTRIGDNVGRAIVVAKHCPYIIRVRLAISMRGAVVTVARAEARNRSRGRYARRTQLQILQPGHRDGFEPVAREFRAISPEHEVLLRGRHSFALAAPAVVLQPCAAHELPP